ncbi:DNA repair protein RecN [Colwellia psychrerythraea]|uniref:DNA repair protein RecN n=1 Tax=Colwellia psychrerythraea TaxID=28229 RepID=A0A099L2L1_COLPS|nr:DNA repair protein RecN [Colwellia psychrerythraea]KGJ96397.1 DNA repair protein RecN [Colwellia psychrerythraea]
MLLQLNIQNFAIVRSLDIDWQPGMTTITGETGAGKSIAIDGLGLCLGDRATTNVVRPNCKKADLAATFETKKNKLAKAWLKQHDLVAEHDSECILRRVISAEGRSKSYINGCQVPLVQLKEIGQLLINIHGQHDHQLIVKANQQCRLLDNYANHSPLLSAVKHYAQQWNKLNKELELLQQSKQQREAEQQLIQYQVTELDEFSLQPDEFSTLEQDYKRHSNAQDLLDSTLSSLQSLSQNDNFNILDSLRECSENINSIARVDNQLNDVAAILSETLIQLDEANNDLSHYYQQLELDPQSYAIIEERYSTALLLAKKHQISPENLVNFHSELKQQLASISGDETRINVIIEELEITKQHFHESAEALSRSRQKSAKGLSKLISKSMQELNMPHGKFYIAVESNKQQDNHRNNGKEIISTNGIDHISFQVSINPGQALDAMHKVASGGELSRISLAMQVILADKVITPTLIFDEVDVGISGPTAAMVGKKLQQLSKNTQVICVTHLPQVACKGHQQLFVSKSTDGELTETQVSELSEANRVKEIARLLAGDKISQHSLANAQELLAS